MHCVTIHFVCVCVYFNQILFVFFSLYQLPRSSLNEGRKVSRWLLLMNKSSVVLMANM